MSQFEHIVFPTDRSASADRAFQYALDLVRRNVGTLDVIHAFVPDVLEGIDDIDTFLDNGLPADIKADLIRKVVVAHHLEAVKLPHKVHIVTSSLSPASAILDYASSNAVDLLVMGTNGRRGLDKLLLGHTTDEVVRSAPCPVLAVSPNVPTQDEAPEVRKILVPVDLSAHSGKVLQFAAHFATVYQAELHLLNVVKPLPYPHIVALSDAGLPSNWPSFMQAQMTEHMNQLLTATTTLGMAAEIHVEHGPPATVILDFAAQAQMDMIVMGTHGHTGIDRLFLGSVAERVVRAAPCPVVTYHTLKTDLDTST